MTRHPRIGSPFHPNSNLRPNLRGNPNNDVQASRRSIIPFRFLRNNLNRHNLPNPMRINKGLLPRHLHNLFRTHQILNQGHRRDLHAPTLPTNLHLPLKQGPTHYLFRNNIQRSRRPRRAFNLLLFYRYYSPLHIVHSEVPHPTRQTQPYHTTKLQSKTLYLQKSYPTPSTTPIPIRPTRHKHKPTRNPNKEQETSSRAQSHHKPRPSEQYPPNKQRHHQ